MFGQCMHADNNYHNMVGEINNDIHKMGFKLKILKNPVRARGPTAWRAHAASGTPHMCGCRICMSSRHGAHVWTQSSPHSVAALPAHWWVVAWHQVWHAGAAAVELTTTAAPPPPVLALAHGM
eukprot:366578-Chlamydomonas_euryale.AAC.5